MNKQLLFLTLLWFPLTLSAQLGGRSVYQVLDFSPSARITALGGSLITVSDEDVSLGFQNPALLNEDMHLGISFNHNLYLSDIEHGYAAYAHHLEKPGITLHGGIQYVSYGDFQGFDEFENPTGTFDAGETVITMGVAKPLYERLTVGANLKMISSSLEGYESFGMAADIGAFYHTENDLNVSLVFRNMGTQFSTYFPGEREPLPFDIQLGVSKKLKYLPFRFSIIAHNLQRWNILYDDPDSEEEGGLLFIGDEGNNDRSAFAEGVDNFFRHFIFSGEFLFGKAENVRLRFAYNHLRRQELQVDNLRSMAGFSFGMGVKISKFRIEVGHAVYHLAGGATHFSFSTNIQEFTRGK